MSKTIKEVNLSGKNIADEGVTIVIKAMFNKKKKYLNVLSFSNKNKISSYG